MLFRSMNTHDKTEELYDLRNDPHENNNVIDEYESKAEELRLELARILNDNDLKY